MSPRGSKVHEVHGVRENSASARRRSNRLITFERPGSQQKSNIASVVSVSVVVERAAATSGFAGSGHCPIPINMRNTTMQTPRPRATLAIRASIAHFAGLVVIGFYGTIGTTAGFGSGAWLGPYLGGLFSIPWFSFLCLVIWFFAELINRYVLAFCLVGPIIVCGTWWVFLGQDLLDSVAISCVVSSFTFFALSRWERHKKARAAQRPQLS